MPRAWLAATLIFVFAAAVRLVHIEWDQNHFFHPDERAIVSAVQRISFRPLNLNPDWFNYGTLPIYLTKIVSSIGGLVDQRALSYDGIIVSGRQMSAVLGALTVLVVIGMGRRLYGDRAGLLAGLLLAACVLHVQNSRFATVDITLTFFVSLALAQLAHLCEDGRPRRFLWAGVCIGLAVATKFSAVPLFLPLAIAGLWRIRVDGKMFPAAGWTMMAVVAAIGAFAVAQPYALLNYARYIRDVSEQSVMVRNAGAYPYTTQYMHLTKYVYELEQLVLWCMAPALGLTAVWATLSRPVTAWRERRGSDWMLLAWVVPFFCVTGWFEVKFPRYLLPIYPVMILWAADWLVRIERRRRLIGRALMAIVVAGTLAYTAAFVATYTRDHTVVEASIWAYEHIPAGSKVLSQDWDEGFPFGLPGKNPGQFKVVDFGYYGYPDTPAKMRKLAQELATSDYIVFQTKRLYGATTRAPERYPLTNNYFYQLFAGDLGFTLIHEVAARPSLLGFEVPDELADESLTVYDHPKVLFFQNSGRIGENELYDKIMTGLPSRPLSRDDLLRAAPSETGALESRGAPPVRSSMLAVVLFAGFAEVLGIAVYFILRRWLPTRGAYALCKPLGVLLFAYISWILVSLGGASFTQGTLLAVALVLCLLGWSSREAAPASHAWADEIVAAELVYWVAFGAFLLVRAYNPEVYWGEKPMDFSFLNAMFRATTMPPPEPWFAGSPLHYSYFGYYLVAAIGKAVHVHPALVFNLGIGLIAGLAAVGAFALATAITDSWAAGVLGALLAIMVGNLSGPGEAIARHREIDFHYFWATSRVIRDTINEYPMWSFLFADLHAHLMVMPITLSFITLTVIWIRSRIIDDADAHGVAPVLLLLLSLTLGAIIVTNGWSLPTYAAFFPFIVGTIWLAEAAKPGFFGFWFGLIGRVIVPTAAIGAGAYLLFWPFWAHFVPPERNFGWELINRATPKDFALIFGLYLFVLVPFVLTLWLRSLRRRNGSFGVMGAIVALLGVGLLVAAPFVSTRATLAALFFLAVAVLLAPATAKPWRIPLAMSAFAFAVTCGTDVVWVWDRMNTIFKFYLESWFMLSIASAVAAPALWRRRISLGYLRWPWKLSFVALVGVAIFTGVTSIYGVITTNRVPTPKPSLDGVAYLQERSPYEYAAFEWLNQHVAGIPVLLEAHGDSYQEFTRVSMNTGLPTVLGWAYHVFQRAHPWSEINLRKADIETAYTSDNKDVVATILERYHVSLIFIGSLERRTYAGGNLERFREWKDLATPVYQNEGVTIFAVNGRFQGATPVSAIEEIPQIAGADVPPAQDAPGRLQQPRGIGISAKGELYISDFGNNRVQEFAPDTKLVRHWGKQGDLPGQFKEPCGVDVGPNGDVFVADTWNHRVQQFAPDGKYVREWSAGFYGPRGVAVAPDGRVYVADTGNNRIFRFSPDGKQERVWGAAGKGVGQFIEAMGITVDAGGTVYVCDNGNGRVQAFTTNGEPLFQFQVDGWESKVYSEPDVAVDGEGHIWVTVPGAKEIRAYDRTGKVLKTLAHRKPAEVVLDTPMGIAFDASSGSLVVTDLDGRIVRLPKQQF